MSISGISNNTASFSQVRSNSPFAQYVKAMQSKCHLSRLTNKILKWFNDMGGKGREKKFDYRFTGKDSRGFVSNFMFLISSAEKSTYLQAYSKAQVHLHALAFLCLTLRDCISLFSRVEIGDQEVSKLDDLCKTFFRVYVFFFAFHPTVWTLGFIVPAHTKDMKMKYGLGLGLNSMEGRESKHVSISRYSQNTHFHARWQQIFMHEFISLIWLREHGNNQTSPVTSSGLTYVPSRVSKPAFCYCGFDKDPDESHCEYCLHTLRSEIIESSKQGKLVGKLQNYGSS